MPETLTKYFGPIEYREADIVQFPTGLPAFEDETQFLAIEPPASAPIVFLQACGDLAFAFSRCLSWPWILSMNLAVTWDDLQSLDLEQPPIEAGLTCLAVIAVTENGAVNAN